MPTGNSLPCLDSDELKRIERSFDPAQYQPPVEIAAARQLAESVLDAISPTESCRLRTLVGAIGATPEVCQDRVYVIMANAASALGTTVEDLARHVQTTRTTVGTMMSQSGKK